MKRGFWLALVGAFAVAAGVGADVWTGPGTGNCYPAPADYDGDGRTDYAQLCAGAWHFYNPDGTYLRGIWTGGLPQDRPVPADYDGDGRDDVVLYRDGAWLAYDPISGVPTWSLWTGGGAGSIALPIDLDGDGEADFSAYLGGAWHFYNEDGSYLKGIWTGGHPLDIPVPGDYDGDLKEDIVVFRGGAWLFYDFVTGANTAGVFTGAASFNGDPIEPAPIDFDGDGTLDFTVFAGGPWHFFNDNGTYRGGVWTGGLPGDKALSRKQQR